MKCPKCSYVSFDGLFSCKKCGFVFFHESDAAPGKDISSALIQTGNGPKEKQRQDGSDNLQKTVASIRESLDEIEGKTPGEHRETSQSQSLQIDTEELKLRVDDEYVEKSKKFPEHSEINWEESVPIASDQLNLVTPNNSSQDSQETQDTNKTEISYTETTDFKAEIKKIGEELKQIEESTKQQEQNKGIGNTAQGFDISKVNKGGFWIRLAATIIDNVILYLLAVILSTVGLIALGMGSSGIELLNEDEMMQLFGPLYLFNAIITIVYYTYFHGVTGQTPGKMVCKLKVVNRNGEPIGYARAFLRWIGYIISSFVFCLGFLWVVWDKNKQGWHDKIAKSYVIYYK
jgi:uncharacterized RDD family membrane protein YckC